MLSTFYAESTIANGTRRVTRDDGERQQLAMPHMLKCYGGMAILLSLAGRPPLPKVLSSRSCRATMSLYREEYILFRSC